MDRYDEIENKYDFLDCPLEIPEGWFDLVDEMLGEIQTLGLPKDQFGFLQIKEKYGQLRVYWYGDERIEEIVDKYEELSKDICCHCGKPATKISLSWICPWCDECAEKTEDCFKDL